VSATPDFPGRAEIQQAIRVHGSDVPGVPTSEQRLTLIECASAAVDYAVAWDRFWKSVRALESANRDSDVTA
jgi:hypothetical protein